MSGLRCVAHDLALGVIQLLLAGRRDIASALQADRALRATARAPASRFVPLARLHRRLEIVEQFPRTTVQEVPV
jgi:hypothetical protein